MPPKITSGLVERIAELNRQGFGSVDWYSQPENIAKFLSEHQNSVLVHRQDNKVTGYYLLTIKGKVLDGVRLAVSARQRNKKIGTKLIRRALRAAKAAGRVFTTYTRRDNLGSFNLHMRLGMRLIRVDDNYLYLSTP